MAEMTNRITSINWSNVLTEASEMLRSLVRMDTTNPPGNETAAAHYVAKLLASEGFVPEVVESDPGRGSLVCRWLGTREVSGALLLMSHLDVVGVERLQWLRDPFAAELVNGYIWGRGTLDNKNLTVAQIISLLLLKRAGFRPKRDILLVASADEETGGEKGFGWLVKNRPEIFEGVRYGLNEGGGHDFVIAGRRFYTCQTGEKGICRLRLTTKGNAGHAATPRGHLAIYTLARALLLLKEFALPTRIVPTQREFLNTIIQALPETESNAFSCILETGRVNVESLPGPMFLRDEIPAMMASTLVPTVVRAGERPNVIPSEANAVIDARLLPGHDAHEFIEMLRSRFTSGGLDLDITLLDDRPGIEFEFQTPLFDCIRSVMVQHEPDAHVVPYLSPMGTDAKHLRGMGIAAYGFKPMRQLPEALKFGLVHGHNERISLDNLLLLTRVTYDIIAQFCL